jgi:flagellar hook-associated protein FlgK
MLFGFFGRVSNAPQLSNALDAGSQRVRSIAQRVAGATITKESGFSLQGTATPETASVNLEEEMTRLADEQLRYEAAAKLLEKTYQKIRLSIRER